MRNLIFISIIFVSCLKALAFTELTPEVVEKVFRQLAAETSTNLDSLTADLKHTLSASESEKILQALGEKKPQENDGIVEVTEKELGVLEFYQFACGYECVPLNRGYFFLPTFKDLMAWRVEVLPLMDERFISEYVKWKLFLDLYHKVISTQWRNLYSVVSPTGDEEVDEFVDKEFYSWNIFFLDGVPFCYEQMDLLRKSFIFRKYGD